MCEPAARPYSVSEFLPWSVLSLRSPEPSFGRTCIFRLKLIFSRRYSWPVFYQPNAVGFIASGASLVQASRNCWRLAFSSMFSTIIAGLNPDKVLRLLRGKRGARMSILIHEQAGRRIIFYPDDRHLRQYAVSCPTLISIEIWLSGFSSGCLLLPLSKRHQSSPPM